MNGNARIGCLLVFVGIAMLWGGSQGLTTWARHRQPFEISCADFAANRPEAKWLRLTECKIDISRPSDLGVVIPDIYLPVRSPGAAAGSPVHIMLAKYVTAETLEKKLTAAADPEASSTPAPSPEIPPEPVKNPVREIVGLVRFGIELKESDHSGLLRRDPSLASDFVIVDEGEEPRPVFSLVAFCIGLWLVTRTAWGLIQHRRRRGRFEELKASFESGERPRRQPRATIRRRPCQPEPKPRRPNGSSS